MPDLDWRRFNAVAARLVPLLGPLAAGGGRLRVLRLHDVPVPAGRRAGAHAHAWCELSVVRSGCIAYAHDGHERRVAAGGTFFMPPGRRHGWRVVRAPAVITGYQLLVEGVGGLPAAPWTLPAADLPRSLVGALHRPGVDEGEFAALLRAHLAWTLARLLPARGDGEGDPASRPAEVLQFIQQRLAEDLRPEAVARRFGMTTRHLNRILVQAAGGPLRRYMAEQRLQRAAQALAWGDGGVAAIGRSVGYPDPGHFGRLFRRRFGCSPLAWRAERRRGR